MECTSVTGQTDGDIYIPSPEDQVDLDDVEMQMGKTESLRDPGFESDQAAQEWEPNSGVQE
jgi:hypothetical protein